MAYQSQYPPKKLLNLWADILCYKMASVDNVFS